MSFDSLIGNDRVKRALRSSLTEKRLHHSLIFSGPEGVGKREFALTLAKAVNCLQADDDSCDSCSACRKIADGEHIDLTIVEPETTVIKVEQMRRMCEQAYYKPFEARTRVFMLDPADALNDQAANAMLKTLEEPPETSLVILITSRLSRLLPTVRSRCQIHHFTLLRTDEIEKFLKERFQRPEREIRLLARLSGGRIGRALEIDLSVYEEMRRDCVELLGVIAAKNRVRLVKAAEYLGKKLGREDCEQRLTVLNGLTSDLLRLIVGADEQSLINLDVMQKLGPLAGRFTAEGIERLTCKLETYRKDLQRNINRQVALEQLLLSETV
jgi:DNA polymerase-3 subunit delta'